MRGSTFIFTICALIVTSSQSETVEIEIENGKLIGEHRNHFYAFEGVPYAEPPTGRFRFEPPRSYAQKWDKPYSALKVGK